MGDRNEASYLSSRGIRIATRELPLFDVYLIGPAQVPSLDLPQIDLAI